MFFKTQTNIFSIDVFTLGKAIINRYSIIVDVLRSFHLNYYFFPDNFYFLYYLYLYFITTF